MKKYTLLFSTIFLLAACATDPGVYVPAQWKREGTSAFDTRTKLASCTYNVGMNKVAETEKNQLIHACMEASGFRWIPAHYKRVN